LSYLCACCGKEHAEQPLSFAADFPDPYANLTLDARDARAIVSSDQCIIDGEQFYIRGCLELPIQGSDSVFLWGLWARVHEADFDEIDARWDLVGRESTSGPYKGRLANKVPAYPDSINLRLTVRMQPAGKRPLFFVDEDHALAFDQRRGLSPLRAEEYGCMLLQTGKTGESHVM
jgi:hypothetical protein